MVFHVKSLHRRIRDIIPAFRQNASILDNSDGGEKEFNSMFENTTRLLGEGQFGVVTLVQRKCEKRTTKIRQKVSGNRHSNVSLPAVSRLVAFEGNDEAKIHQLLTSSTTTADNNTEITADENEFQSTARSSLLFACKKLQKGIVYKDHIFYKPLSPEELRTEVDCLRLLKGEHSCIRLHAVFEASNFILLVTTFCPNGHLLEYQKQHSLQNQNNNNDALKLPCSEIGSIAYQLLDAVRHCAEYGVIHRDIKAQNCLISKSAGLNLTLIDFGSSAIHPKYTAEHGFIREDEDYKQFIDLPFHSTFVGTPFYRSPEMIQMKSTYTQKTDVWSAGVVFYVAAFGFPSKSGFGYTENRDACKRRQEILDFFYCRPHQNSSSIDRRNWNDHLSDSISTGRVPQSLVQLIDQCLTYDQNLRPNARDILRACSFLTEQSQVDRGENN